MKRFSVVLLASIIAMLAVLTACSRKDSDNIEGEQEEQEVEVEFLTFTDEKISYDIKLKTDDGVTFSCSSPYLISADFDSDNSKALFCLEQEYVKENYGNQLETKFQLVTNAKIVGIQYFDYKNQIIVTKKTTGNVVTIPETYKGKYVSEVMIFLEYEGKLFQTTFSRTGEY